MFFFSVEKIKQTVKIDASTVEIEERGVKLRLTVVDTPGFGDSLNSIDWLVEIYIKIKTCFSVNQGFVCFPMVSVVLLLNTG